MLQDVARLARTEFGIDRHEDRAQTRQREKQRHHVRAVGRHHADAIARADATRVQRACGGVDAQAEIGVGQGARAVGEQRMTRALGAAAGEHAVERRVVRRIAPDDLEWGKHGGRTLAQGPEPTHFDHSSNNALSVDISTS